MRQASREKCYNRVANFYLSAWQARRVVEDTFCWQTGQEVQVCGEAQMTKRV
jgi:hypothetical protein